jgi:hypothetical protein
MSDPAAADADAVTIDHLAELSKLLGVEVRDVHQLRVLHGDLRQQEPNAFQLLLHRLSGPWWTRPVRSRELRSPYFLNGLAAIWGRSPDLPELTRADGRRALRLMHEHTEAMAALGLDTTGTNHLKENDR